MTRPAPDEADIRELLRRLEDAVYRLKAPGEQANIGDVGAALGACRRAGLPDSLIKEATARGRERGRRAVIRRYERGAEAS